MRLLHVFPSRSAGDLQGSGRRQHGRLRVRQPRQARHRHPDRQLRPAAGTGGRPELLRVRRRRPLPDPHRQQRRRLRRHDLLVQVHHHGGRPGHVPVQHRPDRVAGQPELEPPPVLHRRPVAPRAQPADAGLEPGLPAVQHRPAVHPGLPGARRAGRALAARRREGLRRTARRGLLRRPRLDLRPRGPAPVRQRPQPLRPAQVPDQRPRGERDEEPNVHSIAIQVPITDLTDGGHKPTASPTRRRRSASGRPPAASAPGSTTSTAPCT